MTEGNAAKMPFFASYYQAARMLPEERRGAFVMALLAYSFDGVEPDLEGAEAMAFVLIRPNIDSSLRRAKTNSGNASKATAETSGKTTAKATARTTGKTSGETAARASAKTTGKTNLSKDKDKDRDMDRDMDMDKEGEGSSFVTRRTNELPSHASGGAAAAVPKCPLCGTALRLNAKTGLFRCPSCQDEYEHGKVAWE